MYINLIELIEKSEVSNILDSSRDHINDHRKGVVTSYQKQPKKNDEVFQ